MPLKGTKWLKISNWKKKKNLRNC